MLVPLTASLYASGTLPNTDNVLVDVGTGYFIEVCWTVSSTRHESRLVVEIFCGGCCTCVEW